MPPGRPGDGLWLFGVEPTSVQVTWRAVGGEPPGSVVVDGLEAGREVDVNVRLPGRAVWRRPVRLLDPPPGPERFRFATLSDLHLGEDSFGFLGGIVEEPARSEAYPVRAVRAAIDELRAWGAELLLIKGDVTEHGSPVEWECFAQLTAALPFPVMTIPGNHDTFDPPPSPWPWRPSRSGPSPIPPPGRTAGVQVRDVDGIRIVAADTTRTDRRTGRLGPVADEIVAAAAEAEGPAFVALHHQLMTRPIPTYLPVGISSDEATLFLDALARANPATLVSSGHTHRHRRRDHRGVVITEVGSPKDYPGTWAGYVVHDGGIRQVVRRIAAPDVLRWTDRSTAAALGAWGWWAPGRLSDRCFSHPWPSARPVRS
jgi:3',5'-cyclic-AMP phosphodiesterase